MSIPPEIITVLFAFSTAILLVITLLLLRQNRLYRQKAGKDCRSCETRRAESLTKLAGGIAHDFNNILGAILGYAEFIQEDVPAGHPISQFAAQILTACQRGQTLVDHVLIYAKRYKTDKTVLALPSLIEDYLPLIREGLAENITFDAHIKVPVLNILADNKLIKHVILDLCKNAGDAMAPHSGTITLTLERQSALDTVLPDAPNRLMFGTCPAVANFAVITVKDTGGGIDQSHLPFIFDPFFTTKDVGKGTGLGLCVILGIVLAHDGAIVVSSQKGQGAQFCVILPEAE